MSYMEMKPAEYSNRTFKCPFEKMDGLPTYSKFNGCTKEMDFEQLVTHLQIKHPTARLMAWICAAIWEDVCSNQEPDCA